ncbi:hypothetical protein ISTM_469 [Insectomime virus]|uniref:Uncharacterized protein n=1 Tax=Tunisvirus fontaine2 TaxID=1421067 RepID=V9SGN1_9VIRU|nr:hypothetical protein D1R32_gp332 [Tunisvirus fontaine2]AHA46367.1 hypothetical protein ISTM_469 [Insectomime virus]AHC55049.1 hypothetical protein TNS_ORF331 [Tunisvirus fontaine2]
MSRKKKQEEPKSFPLFGLVREYTLDPFWCDILENFMNGNLHPGIRVKQNSVFIGAEEFETSCFEEDGDQDQRAETSMMILGALRSELGIMSEMEMFEAKFESFSSESQSSSWTKVKSKAKREMFVLQFTEKEQKEKCLTNEERQSLYWVLITSIDLGCIRPENIVMKNGRIQQVEGLVYDPETASYSLKEFTFPNSKSSTKAKLCSKLGINFARYLEAKAKEVECR